MNKMKLLTTISLLLMGFNLAYAAPCNFCLLKKGDKQIKIWGDLHKRDYAIEKLRFDIFDKNINRESCLKGKKCWVIEGCWRSADENLVEDMGSSPVEETAAFLHYKAVQQKMMYENIDFKFMYHGIKTDIIGSMSFLLTILDHVDMDYLCAKFDKYFNSTASCSIQELMIALEHEISAMIHYFRSREMSAGSRSAVDTMIHNLNIAMENLKDYYGKLKLSSELKEDFFTLGWVEAFKKYAGSQAKMDLKYVCSKIKIDFIISYYLIPFKVRMGDLNFIIRALEYLEQYNDITLYVGAAHAYTLREFFINNGFIQTKFVGSDVIQKPEARGPLRAEEDPFPSLLSIDDIEKIYAEIILKDIKVDAESKVDSEVAAGLRPAAPRAASTIAHPSSLFAPSAAANDAIYDGLDEELDATQGQQVGESLFGAKPTTKPPSSSSFATMPSTYTLPILLSSPAAPPSSSRASRAVTIPSAQAPLSVEEPVLKDAKKLIVTDESSAAVPTSRKRPLDIAPVAANKSHRPTAVSTATQAISNYICVVCRKPTALRCSICKKTYYCNIDCQTAHWPTHKVTCKAAI